MLTTSKKPNLVNFTNPFFFCHPPPFLSSKPTLSPLFRTNSHPKLPAFVFLVDPCLLNSNLVLPILQNSLNLLMESSNSVKAKTFPDLGWNHSMDRLNPIMPANCLIQFPTDTGFKERAAKYSSFSSDNYKELQLSILETGKLSRVSSSQSLKSKETSSVTDLGSRQGECKARKRKATPKCKAKVAEETDMNNVKKCWSAEACDEKVGFQLNEDQNGEEKEGKDIVSELPEPPKGYIHVRARRGEATDSHSLAERVRREKISQRMKVLQDLVPGCNKITGKAVMLDEIINYVQSLQRQVEFLSMKLATMNPRLDCNLANLFSKELLLSQTNASLPSSLYPLDNSAATFPCTHQSNEGNPLHFGVIKGMETHISFSQVNCTLYQAPCLQPTSIDVFGAPASQLGNTWDDDLHSIVQMNLVQN